MVAQVVPVAVASSAVQRYPLLCLDNIYRVALVLYPVYVISDLPVGGLLKFPARCIIGISLMISLFCSAFGQI